MALAGGGGGSGRVRVGRWRPVSGAARGRAGREFYCQVQANSVCAGVGGGAAIKLKKFQGLYIRAFQNFSGFSFSGLGFRF